MSRLVDDDSDIDIQLLLVPGHHYPHHQFLILGV
jgi:hypothetical protein